MKRLFPPILVTSIAVAALLLRYAGPRAPRRPFLPTPSIMPRSTGVASLPLSSPPTPETSILTSGGPPIYVSDGTQAVYAVDPKTHAVVGTIPLPLAGKPIPSPDGQAIYIAQGLTGVVSILDAQRGEVIGRLAPTGWPAGVAFSPDGREVYVTESNYGRLLVIDRATRARRAAIATSKDARPWNTGAGTAEVVVGPDGHRAYVVNTLPATLAIIDLVKRKLVEELPLGQGATDDLGAIAISTDGQRVYVLQPRAEPRLWIMETATREVSAIPLDVEGQPSDIALSPGGGVIYIAVRGPSGGLLILDSTLQRKWAWLEQPGGCDQVVVSPDGDWVYLVSAAEGRLTVVNASSFRVTRTVDLYSRRGPEGVPLEAPGRITFLSDRDGRLALYVINPDGTGLTRIAQGSGPRWSPDGNWILFRGSAGYVYNTAKRTLKPAYRFYVIRPDGRSNPTQVMGQPEPPVLSYDDYAWSPDGITIALLATRDANGNGEWDEEDRSILYVVPLDGEPIRVGEAGAPPLSRLRWSPRGDFIALGQDGSSPDAAWVYLVAVDQAVLRGQGGQLQRLVAGRGFAWSPHGRRLAFVDETGTAIKIIDVENPGEPQLLYSDSRPKQDLAWSPNGRHLAYVAREEESGQGAWPQSVYILSLEVGQSLPVAGGSKEMAYFGPSWSPDSRYVAFVGVERVDGRPDWQTSEIYVAAADGSSLGRLTSNGARDLDPRWSP